MASFGLTPDGFVQKTLQDILDDIETEEKQTISSALNTSATSVLGQLNGVYASKLAELWALSTSVYRAQSPEFANDESLDNVAAITGALRLSATNSTVELTVNLDAGTTLLVGRVVSVLGAGDRFVSTEEVTNSGGSPADFPVAFESEQFGPITANAGTLTVIETPVAGWNSATNALDAALGRDLETDADFRLRREQLLRISGAATVEAIRSAIRDVDGVTEAFVFENTTLVVDGNGLPGKSFEVVLTFGVPATNQTIADAIFLVKPAGIEAFGSINESVVDSQGFLHSISFSTATEIEIFIAVTVVTNPVMFGGGNPVVGEAEVVQALLDEGGLLGIGDDVIALALNCASLDVSGVQDVTAFTIDISGPPVGTANIPIGVRELATFDSSRITVTVT